MSRIEAIMSYKDHCYDDITELAKIRREMSLEAKKLDIIANQTEEDYNLAR